MLIVYERVNDIQINGFLCSVETTKKRSLSLQPQVLYLLKFLGFKLFNIFSNKNVWLSLRIGL